MTSAPASDTDRALLPWRRLPFPTPWREVFGRSAPVHLEVGFGDGRFTLRRAQDEPEQDFVGIERSGVSVRRALAKVVREGATNVRLVKGGAQIATQQLFARGCLRSITLNFPDPWPKKRHVGHRLLRVPFYRLAASRLEPSGEIRLATDYPEYLVFACDEAEASGLFVAREAEPPPAVFETKYALKWRDRGKPLHYVVFLRTEAPAPALPPLERPVTMPHALLRGRFPHGAPFEKTVLPHGGGHVVLHELARSLGGDRGHAVDEGRDRWLVRATVDEPDLIQQLLVVVQRREEDAFIVRLASFGDPIVTAAVRGAVHGVTEWLLASGEMRLEARNY